MGKINLLFPIETINRELDYRLFLAAMTVNSERRIFVGHYDALNDLILQTKGGIYVGKSIFNSQYPTKVDNFINLKNHGYKLIHHDEEGAVYSGDEEDWKETLKKQVNAGFLCDDDYICTWGKFQADYYRSRQPACSKNILSTGHPRFDLYKPKYREFFREETNLLKEKFGDYVLFNTNLSFANHGLGLSDIFSSRWHFKPNNFQKRTEFFEHWVHKSTVFLNMLKLINRLSGEFPKIKFIIRPHPSENLSSYQTIFKDYDNVEVIHEGSVTPWILASRLLIHDGCTTAIEAFLAEKPIINYQSNPENKYNLFLPNNVGLSRTDENETVETVQQILDGKEHQKQKDKLHPKVHDLMENFKEDTFANLIKVIDRVEKSVREENQEFMWNEKVFKTQEQMRFSKNKVKSFIRPFFKEKQMEFNYYRNKFYGLDKKSILRKTNTIKDILNKDFEVNYYNERLLIFEQN